jgi:hypothetical protein
MIYGEEKSKGLFSNENEKFVWQLVIALLIIDLPFFILTTLENKIIWTIIYILCVIILSLIFSILKILKSRRSHLKKEF